MCVPGQPGRPAAVAPASAGQALAALRGALAYLAKADATTLSTAEQAGCLRELERAESVRIAARSRVLSAFNAGCGYEADGQGSARSWLRWQARITGAAAGAATSWMRRLAAHAAVGDALAAGQVAPSWAREICDWSDLLPESVRPDADAILLAAAAAGAGLEDLAGLAGELRARTATPDRDGGDDGAGRSVRLDLHYRGAGRLRGDLTPRCAAALQAVLDALGKKAGPEDTRTRAQRDHDALEDALRRLIAAGCVPDRAGQPTKVQLHMTLDQLLDLQPGVAAGQPGPEPGQPGSREAARRALFPDRGDLSEPSIAPIVTGHVDHELLDRLAATLLGQPGTPGTGSPSDPASPAAARLAAGYARPACTAPPPPSACPWTAAPPPTPSPRTCAAPSSCATSAAPTPAATYPPPPARSTTSSPAPKAAPPAWKTCTSAAPSTTSSPSTPGAGNSHSTPTAPKPPSAPTAPALTTATTRHAPPKATGPLRSGGGSSAPPSGRARLA